MVSKMRLAMYLIAVIGCMSMFKAITSLGAAHKPAVDAYPMKPSTDTNVIDTHTHEEDFRDKIRGKRVLAIGNFFLFDYTAASGPIHQHLTSVEGQFCEFAASSGVTVDLMLVGYAPNIERQLNPKKIMKPCIAKFASCRDPHNVKGCFMKHFAKQGISYSAIFTRDDALLLAVPLQNSPSLPYLP